MAPTEFAKTSKMSGVLVLVNNPWQISIKIPKLIAPIKTTILFLGFGFFLFKNKYHSETKIK